MKTTISTDRTRVTIRLDATLSAQELQDVIAGLGEVRANMAPPVATNPIQAAERGDNAIVQADPHFVIALRAEGGFRLWLRNAGLGWIALEIPEAKARALADYIVGRSRPSRNLSSEEIPDPGNPH